MNNINNINKVISMNDFLNFKKNIYNYIVPIDLSEIKWEIFDREELYQFYRNNYYDGDDFVYWEDENDYVPLGMHYLMFEEYNTKLNFFIGTILNNIGKRTIVACITFMEKCELDIDKEAVTSIETIETNYFYQGMGILNIMLNEFAKIINKDKNMIVTRESIKGKRCHVMEHIKRNLYKNGFEKDIRFEYEIDEEYIKKLSKKI